MLEIYKNCQTSKHSRIIGHITVEEINTSLNKLIKFIQHECFHENITRLRLHKTINPKSKIFSLRPFLTTDNILRVGGRLEHSSFSYEKKHSILLPNNHHFTHILMQHEHEMLGHAGPEMILSSIRDKYWPINGRNIAKSTFRKCIKCFHVNPKSNIPIMSDLSKTRLTPTPPFFNTGLDCAGPILIKNKNGRGCRTTRCYISLFVCFSTRAIHLELVSELTTAAFISAFRRFVSRRGKPANVYSDNGTNFVGANNQLHKLGMFLKENHDKIATSLSTYVVPGMIPGGTLYRLVPLTLVIYGWPVSRVPSHT